MVSPKALSWGHSSFYYINDLPNISKALNFYLFADDTNMYYESKSLIDMEKTINKELSKLYLNCRTLTI